jgi:hypothetical protein
MPLFRRRRTAAPSRADLSGGLRHLEEWAAARRGVEAFVEPQTAVTDTTVLLVAASGEWTRRRVDGPKAAAEFARRLSMPVYDAQIVGYPQRMRDWNARQSAEARNSGGETPA